MRIEYAVYCQAIVSGLGAHMVKLGDAMQTCKGF